MLAEDDAYGVIWWVKLILRNSRKGKSGRFASCNWWISLSDTNPAVVTADFAIASVNSSVTTDEFVSIVFISFVVTNNLSEEDFNSFVATNKLRSNIIHSS